MLPLALVMLAAVPVVDDDVMPVERLQELARFRREAPRGLPAQIPFPEDSPLTPSAWELGRALFFDPVLSIDRTIACASCHVPQRGFASEEKLPKGVLDRRARRHAPTLINRAFGSHFSWDGKAKTLEEQALLPIENPDEMALPLEDALDRLRSDSRYLDLFRQAYDAGIDRETVGKALATFVRTLVLADSPVEAFRYGDASALSARERAGLWIFESNGRCWRCHSGGNFSDEDFHNTGVGAEEGISEDGRRAITLRDEDRGKFKTPTLRGLAFTAPYMHDGSLETLEEVVAFYRKGGVPNENLDSRIAPLEITDDDAESLVAFLRALSK